MKLETFFEKFDQFADAPNAVEKMRELVLDLAIQGKLVDRQTSEGDGHSLLRKLRTLAPERNSKSRSPKDIIVEPETPLEIPSHWALTTVENTTRETGYFCDGDWVESKDQDPDGDVRLIQLADVGDGEYRDRSARFMTKAAATRLNCSYLQAGDILVARMPDPLGRCCRFPGDTKPAVTVVDVCILRSNVTFFDPDFVVVAINCPQFRRLVSAQATGTTRSRISRSNLSVLPIPLPPLAEQKRIVAKVDELMALCDRLDAQQQERETRHAALARASLARFADAPTPANLPFLFHPSYAIPPADLRKSILTLAVQGKLVPQDPNDEPAEDLVVRVAAEKNRLLRAKEIKTETPLDPISDAEALFPIPASWIWLRAGDLCRPISSGSTPDQSVFHPSEGVPYLKVYNIRNQVVDFDYKRQFIAVNYHREKMKRSVLCPGDVIMNIVGPPLGKVAIVPDAFPEWNCNQAISFFRPIFPDFAPYLYTFLKEGSFLQNIQLIGTAGQDNISVTKCKFIPIPIPPLAEQRRIVAKVGELMALVDKLEQQIDTSQSTAKDLLDALVAELAGTSQS
jgi:type I restriction enzyme S subunit